MSFYTDASLVLIPSGYKDQKVYCAKPVDGSADLTFSRGSDIEATRVNANGYIEKAQVNLLLQSNTFSTAWINNQTTETGGQSGYDGSSNAWKLAESNLLNFHSIYQSSINTGVSTLSVYAKTNGRDLQIRINGVGLGKAFVNYDLSSGAIGLSGGSSLIDSNIESVGGGWYRCSLALNDSGTYGIDIITITDALTSIELQQYIGDGVSGIYIQDAQMNYGLVAQDYQETTTAAVVSGITDNMPRLSYDPANPTCPSLLLEPSRTNAFAQSEAFSVSASWLLSRTSAFGSGSVVNATTSPEGVSNASFIQQASGETDGGGVYTGVPYTSGTTYTLSVFAKQGTNRYLRIGYGIGSGGSGIFCGFDLQDGIAGTPDTGITAKIENYGSGWYRCSITATAQTTGTRNTFVYQSSNLNNFATTPLQGIYIYGAMLESSASYPTSYIPTYGSSATRTADSCIKTGISSLIGQTEGTLFFDFYAFKNNVGHDFWFNISDAATNEWAFIGIDGNNYRFYLKANGGVIFSETGSINEGKNKMAMAYESGNTKLVLNGSVLQTITYPFAFGTTVDFVYFQNSNKGQVNQALLFKTALSDSDLATLTSL